MTQPDHPGSLVQVGWNAGPRHARVFGLAKSYKKKLDSSTMIERDRDAIAVFTIMWGLVNHAVPAEVMSEVNQRLDSGGMPRMATRNAAPSMFLLLVCQQI